jgi:GntR family transcriptional regulator, transcriptional repressor for pyruvate dehydrogenase complex
LERALAKPGKLNLVGLQKPVRPRSLDFAILESLAAYVENAKILPQSRLPSERVLCEALGVGRSSLREALKRWEALGIIEMRKGSGAFLKVAVSPNLLHVSLVLGRPTKVKNLLQILQVRRALEGEAAALCALRASDREIAAIEAALVKMEAAYIRNGGSDEDWQFHQLIIATTGNPFFPQIIQSMRDLLHQLWENALALPDFAHASHPFHRTMYEAIARRDADSARMEAWKLIDSVKQEIREAFPDEA